MFGSQFKVPRLAALSFAPILVKLFGTAAAFLLSVLLARVLGVEEFGAYSLVISAVMVSSIPVQSGIPILATREVARAKASGESERALGLLAWSNRVIFGYVILALAAAMILRIAAPNVEFAFNFLIAAATIGTIALNLRDGGMLRGFERFVKGTLPEVLMRPVVQLVSFLMLFYFFEDLARQAGWALITFVIASASASMTSFVWRRTLVARAIVRRDAAMRPTGHRWWKACVLLTVVGGGQIFFGHIDTLMLGVFGNEREVGAYRVAVQLSMLVIFALSVVNQVLQPRISELHSRGDNTALQKLLAESSMLMFLGTAAPAAVLALIAPQLLDFVFGSEYRNAALALQILILGQIINVMFGSVGTILNMTGLEKEATIGMIIAIILNLVLDVLLIPPFGLNGAAMASALTIVIWNSILRYFVKDRLGLESAGVLVYTRLLLARMRSDA